MRWFYWLEKMAFIGFVVCFLCSLYLNFTLHKNKEAFLKDIRKHADENPNIILTKTKSKQFQGNYNQMFIKPIKMDIVFKVLYIIFGVAAISLHYFK